MLQKWYSGLNKAQRIVIGIVVIIATVYLFSESPYGSGFFLLLGLTVCGVWLYLIFGGKK